MTMIPTRREFLTVGLGVTAMASLGPFSVGAAQPFKPGKAKSVIQIWMWGGPSHLDTFDPKPGAGKDYCGPWDNSLTTNVPNIEISRSLPMLAQCADLYSIVRTMTHPTNHHETASYMMQTGREPGGGLVFPCVGAVIAKIKGYDAGYDAKIPPYVVLTTALGRFSECGFLGPKYKPFVTGGDPNKDPFLVSGYVVEGITEKRLQDRQKMLENLDVFSEVNADNPLVDEIGVARANAFNLLSGDAVKIFDLKTEPETIRTEYGRNWFGQACLMARRLVQVGVPFVAINYRGWDTHKRHFETLTRRQPEWDRGLATLLKDLRDTGLLDTTIVWWGGEFGRTPKIGWESPWFGGRGHYSSCFNAMIAGGGFHGGQVVGESNETGEKVKTRPVAPQDLLGSMYTQLGINPEGPLPNDKGIDVTAMPPASDAGRLCEIMG